MQRVVNWPAGIIAPAKVRVYFRSGHWLLQWWEPAARKNVSERVEGDVIEAVARAREIERRLTQFKSSGRAAGPTGHRELVERFIADLVRRADAGQVQTASVTRLSSALARHYLPYA